MKMFSTILLSIWSFIRPFIVYIILGLIVFFLYIQNKNLREDIKRVDNNYQALAQNSSIQQELTKSEAKEFYKKSLDSILNKVNVKLKNVTNVIITKYNYKDTTISHIKLDTLKVKIFGSENFSINKECFVIKGKIDEGGLYINSVENTDKLTYILYKAYHKHFLFFKWKPYYESKVYSECKKDTMSIQTNLKIQE